MTHPDERAAEMMELFFESAQELLQALNDDALKLEREPENLEIIRSIRRSVHTLKGDAAACGFRELSDLAHEFEDALAVQAGIAPSALVEVALAATDMFSEMLTAYRQKLEPPPATPLRKMIHGLAPRKNAAESQNDSKPAARTDLAWTEYEKLAAQNALNSGQRLYHVRIMIDQLCAMPIAARQLLLNAIADSAEVLATRPQPESRESTQRMDLLLASNNRPETLQRKCLIPTIVAQVIIDAIDLQSLTGAVGEAATSDAPPSIAPPAEQAPRGAAHSHESAPEPKHAAVVADNVLRVDAGRVDTVLNLLGELIIGKSMLQQALTEFGKLHPRDPTRGRFADALAFQSRVLHDLQRSVMKIRMVPVEQLFRRFPRMVRDLAKECGAQVELTVSGQNTDLDKTLLDAIAEPLTHLVRNAVSHAIEPAEERVRLGKPAGGTIRLASYHQGNQVIVEVIDDGRGISVQKVAARAVAQGLLSADQAERLSEAEALDFIFRPGFSTAVQVTEISGRGVGLDVVHSVIEKLKGAVEVYSRPGQGTTFRLKLPLTLAIIKALMFRVNGSLFAVPLNAVSEISRAHEADLHKVENYEVLQLRNQTLSVLRMGRGRRADVNSSDKIFVLVIQLGERKLGLLVDGLAGEEELVIKPLDDQRVENDLVSGASILGDGRVVLILNLGAVIERAHQHWSQPESGLIQGLLLPSAENARFESQTGAPQ